MLSIHAARWLIVFHAIAGAAAVAAATHWVVWLWPFWRGRYARLRGARRFGVIATSLYGVAFAIGLVLYPTYKARVKLEYLKDSAAITADQVARAQASADAAARAAGRKLEPIDPATVTRDADAAADRAENVSRWFDSKENWVPVGLVLGLAAMVMLFAWDPERDGAGPRVFVIGGAIGAAAILWFAAIVGLVTASTRSF